MEQSWHPRNQQQDCVLGWAQASLVPDEVSIAPLQSASSAVISPRNTDCGDSSLHSVEQSSTSIKERDYIGLAEVSSAPPPHNPPKQLELDLAETDLRLGLGLSRETPSGRHLDCNDKVGLAGSHASDVALLDARPLPPSAWQSIPPKSLVDATAIPHVNGHQSSLHITASKNGGKRLYAEAMVDALRMNMNTNPAISMKQPQDPEMKPFLQGMLRAAPHIVPWRCHSDPRSSSYRPGANQKSEAFSIAAMGGADAEVLSNSNLGLQLCGNSKQQQSLESHNDENGNAPPAKGQVVGWPPVRSYRRSTLAACPKPTGEEGNIQPTIYVKVNMDGIPVGRKVDLSAYKSYDGLLFALEDMFQNPNSGYGAHFLKNSEFVLTYEDKEGDWMLVGDVPWDMFTNTVRRLRITRGPDMAGVGSRASVYQP